jgi:hypothetical protein
MIVRIHYNISNKYTRIKLKDTNIRGRYGCKLCDFCTNHLLVYNRHIRSNNHYIRLNQF